MTGISHEKTAQATWLHTGRIGRASSRDTSAAPPASGHAQPFHSVARDRVTVRRDRRSPEATALSPIAYGLDRDLIQYPLYGAVIGHLWSRARLAAGAAGIAVIHAIAAGLPIYWTMAKV